MSKVVVGPKDRRSLLPAGEVTGMSASCVDMANKGQLPSQIFRLKMDVKGVQKEFVVVNGASKFKRYNAIDRVVYAIMRPFARNK